MNQAIRKRNNELQKNYEKPTPIRNSKQLSKETIRKIHVKLINTEKKKIMKINNEKLLQQK